MSYSIVLVEDRPSYLAAMRDAVRADPRFSLLSSFDNSGDAAGFIAANTPDAVVLDLHLGSSPALELLAAARARGPRTAVVMHSASDTARSSAGTPLDGALPDLEPRHVDELLDRVATLCHRHAEQPAAVVEPAPDAPSAVERLVRAANDVAGAVGLAEVLDRVVVSARDLVGAGYAAVGLLAPDGALLQYVHTGHATEGVTRLTRHLAGEAFPPRHLRLRGFLGVPVRADRSMVAVLYVADAVAGAFSKEDERLVAGLAATFGVAVRNAQRAIEAQLQRRWAAETAELTEELFSHDPAGAEDLVLRHVLRAADADLVTLATPVDERTMRTRAAAGPLAAGLAGDVTAIDGTPAGHVLRTGVPWHGRFETALDGDRSGSTVIVPFLVDGMVPSVLTVHRTSEQSALDRADMNHVADLVGQVGLVLLLIRTRAPVGGGNPVGDGDQGPPPDVGAALAAARAHERVAQTLFAAGIGLDAIAAKLPGEIRDLVSAYVDALDRVAKDLPKVTPRDLGRPQAPQRSRFGGGYDGVADRSS